MTEKELEKKISRVYDQAAKEMEAKTTAYLERYKSNLSNMQDLLASGEITQAEYKEWINKQVIINAKWQAQSAELAQEALQADNTAKALIEGEMPLYFADGMNYGTFEVETLFGVDTSFSLYDKQNVLELIKNEPQLLPQLKPESPTEQAIREGKIIRWNQQKITQQVTQGLVQGESIPKIAKRLQTVTDMDKRAAIRNARTATNSARQAGHDASYERANEMGIDIQRMWIAALDDRTRQEHRELDGQVRPVGEPFRVEGYEIMYPCDPSAEPEMVYNCRCTVIAYNPKMNTSLENRNTSKLNEEYEIWKNSKEEPISEQQMSALDKWAKNPYTIRQASIGENEVKYPFYTEFNQQQDNERAKEIEDFVSGHTVHETIYRGLSDLSAEDYEKYTTIGETIDQKGLSSWSTDKSIATGFGGYGNSVIFIQDGSPNARMLDNLVGTTESEVIMSAKQEQVIIKVEEKNGFTFVYTEDKDWWKKRNGK